MRDFDCQEFESTSFKTRDFETSDFETITYEKRGHVAYVTLNRPKVLNAMNLKMHEELCVVWDDIECDDDIWLAVLKGAGEKALSVGQDLKELVRRTESGEKASSFGSRGMPGYPRITERFEFIKPIVCCVDGYALGGGFELALASDIVIASERAIFGLTEARLGLIAGAGGVFRLARQIPQKVAKGMLMTGEKIDATRAYNLGLVNEVCSADNLEATLDRWVNNILSCAPLSIRAIKQVIEQSSTLNLKEAFDAEYKQEKIRQASWDCTEGPKAFTEKRQPLWKAI